MSIFIRKGQEEKTKIVCARRAMAGYALTQGTKTTSWMHDPEQQGCVLCQGCWKHHKAIAQGFVTWTNSPEKEFKSKTFINKALSVLFITIQGIILGGNASSRNAKLGNF